MKNLHIFEKKINSNSKLVPFYKNINDTGEDKYCAPISREWKSIIYFFNNNNNIRNIPNNNINIYYLIKSYFYAFFNQDFIGNKYVSRVYRRKTLNKIFFSKPKIKYTNNKAIVTIYTYNRQIRPLYKNLIKLRGRIRRIIKFIYINTENYKIKNKTIIKIWYVKLMKFRKLLLKVYLNKYKFEKKLLKILKRLIYKTLGINIEFNIINLKKIVYNTDIFTEILALKLKKKKIRLFKATNVILNKARLKKTEDFKERIRIVKRVNRNLLPNKYISLNLSSILTNNEYDLNCLLREIYYTKLNKEDYNIHDIIFNSIKYKLIGGIKLEVKGRLTKRYRADRALHRVDLKGGFKNIDSSFKGLSVMHYLGYKNSNVEYSLYTSKRRIGAYAVKGWIAGK